MKKSSKRYREKEIINWSEGFQYAVLSRDVVDKRSRVNACQRSGKSVVQVPRLLRDLFQRFVRARRSETVTGNCTIKTYERRCLAS